MLLLELELELLLLLPLLCQPLGCVVCCGISRVLLGRRLRVLGLVKLVLGRANCVSCLAVPAGRGGGLAQ